MAQSPRQRLLGACEAACELISGLFLGSHDGLMMRGENPSS